MSDLTLPPDFMPGPTDASRREINIVRLAREIAMDLREIDVVLEQHLVSRQEFEKIKRHPYFVRVLAAEREAWESAINTPQRVRIKAAAMAEDFLPTLYERLVNPKEDLLKVVKGAELVTKLSGIGAEEGKDIDPSSRVVITINMGADNRLQLSKALPVKVIEHEAPAADPADELQQNLFEQSLDITPEMEPT